MAETKRRTKLQETGLPETQLPSLADQVYDQLLRRILDEEYEVHSRLPAEELLAQSFGVSRPIVRAALSRLRDDGIIQSRRGSGSYVLRRPDRHLISVVPLESVSDVQRCYEFRVDVEGSAAAWAARRRDEDDLKAMDQAYREMEQAYEKGALGVEADQMLHLAIARATKNPFFVSVLESLSDQISFAVNLSRSLTLLDAPARQDLVLDEHQAVMSAIRLRQPEVATATMRHHITSAKNRMFVGIQDTQCTGIIGPAKAQSLLRCRRSGVALGVEIEPGQSFEIPLCCRFPDLQRPVAKSLSGFGWSRRGYARRYDICIASPWMQWITCLQGGGVLMDRRRFLAGASTSAAIGLPVVVRSAEVFRLGLTPVFLDNDAIVIERLRAAFSEAMGGPVDLIQRRTYQEITATILDGSVDAAWICGYPFLQHRDSLSLLGVPVWWGRPLYQSYLIVRDEDGAEDLEDLRGDLHAFSDPDSNSGYLVTASDLARLGKTPEEFFSRSIFTYGHRNVVRAVADGLTRSGSVDGYVWETLARVEPGLTTRTKVVTKSEWLGFPPFAARADRMSDSRIQRFGEALRGLHETETGREALQLLFLDEIQDGQTELFDGIAARMAVLGKT